MADPYNKKNQGKHKHLTIRPDGYYGEKDHRRYILESKRLSQGQEGTIFKCHRQGSEEILVAKIFKQYNEAQIEKVKALQTIVESQNLHREIPLVKWPQQLLVEYRKGKRVREVGYLMDYAPYMTMKSTIWRSNWLDKHWTRKELVSYTLRLLDTIQRMHEHNIVMGDISLNNILCDEDNIEPHIVDADSFQFTIHQATPDGKKESVTYLCPGITLFFAAPAIVERYLNEDEEYVASVVTDREMLHSVTVLIFSILMGGMNPYEQPGQCDINSRIISRSFDFPVDTDLGNCELPNMRIWFYLPSDIRYAFYRTFRREEVLSIKEWKALLENYRSKLQQGHYFSKIILDQTDCFNAQGGMIRIEPMDYSPSAAEYPELHQFDYHPEITNPTSLLTIEGDSIQLITYTDTKRLAQTHQIDPRHLVETRINRLDHCQQIDSDCNVHVDEIVSYLSPKILQIWDQMLISHHIHPGHTIVYGTDWLRILGNRLQVVRGLRQATELPIGILQKEEELGLSLRGIIANAEACRLLKSDQPLLHIDLRHTFLSFQTYRIGDARPSQLGNLGLTVMKNLFTHRSDNNTTTTAAIEDLRFVIQQRVKDFHLEQYQEVDDLLLLASGTLWSNVFGFLFDDKDWLPFGQYRKYSKDELEEILKKETDYLIRHPYVRKLDYDDPYHNQAITIVLGLTLFATVMEQLRADTLYVIDSSTAYGALLGQYGQSTK